MTTVTTKTTSASNKMATSESQQSSAVLKKAITLLRSKIKHNSLGSGPPIQSYSGEPCLYQFLAGSGLEEKHFKTKEYLQQINIKRIERKYWPNRCILFQTSLNFYQSQEAILKNDHLTIMNHCDSLKSNLLDSNSQAIPVPTQIALQKLPKSNVICTIQAIGFAVLTFNTFQDLLQEPLLLTFKNLSQNIFPPSNDQTILSQLIQKHSQKYKKKYEPQKKKTSNNQIPYYEIVKQEHHELSRIIFQSLCFHESQYCLWPCLVLQPAIGSINQLDTILQKQTDFSILSYHSEQKKIYKTIINNLLSTQQTQSQSYNDEINNSIWHKINKYRQNNHSITSYIQLLGFNKYLKINQNVVSWNLFSPEEIYTLLNKEHFSTLLPKINDLISDLNAYKTIEKGESNNGNCVGKLCTYQPEWETSEVVCIPLKQDPTCKNNNIFVRILNPKETYMWVSEKDLKVNFALPSFSPNHPFIFNLVATELDVKETMTFIYNYIHSQQQSERLLSHCQQEQLQKCAHCSQIILKYLPSSSCRHCFKLNASSQHLSKSFSQHISKSFNQQSLDSQKPICQICKILLTVQSLRCLKCKTIFHWQCVINSHSSTQLPQKSFFVCQQCMKCDLCQKLIHNHPYFKPEQNQISCINCFIQKECNNFCQICSFQVKGTDTIACQNQKCQQIVHKKCDPIIIQFSPTTSQKTYLCPKCRIVIRRKILRLVIEDLRKFDQCQYYYETCYQQFPDYRKVIKNPMCLLIMREKILEGAYDCNSFETIRKDFELIVKNALTFNMPHDDAYYRAKILYIVGLRFLNHVKKIIQCTECKIMASDLYALYQEKVEEFYTFLNKNYANLLLNHQQYKSIIQVQTSQPRQISLVFNSKEMLLNQLTKNNIKFILKSDSSSISMLFYEIKKKEPIVTNLNKQICYYHPHSRLPIIYQCPKCWQHYCCTKTCSRHYKCPQCPPRNCVCQKQSECHCNSRITDSIRDKLLQFAQQHKITIEDITQFSKYCLRCAQRNIMNKLCYLCNKFCYYGYQQCKCDKYYHIMCIESEIKRSIQIDHPLLGEESDDEETVIKTNSCLECLDKQKEFAKYLSNSMHVLTEKRKKNIQFLKYSEIISELYKSQGILFNSEKLVFKLLKNSPEELKKIQPFLEELIKIKTAVKNILKNQEIQKYQQLTQNIEYKGHINLQPKFYVNETSEGQNERTTEEMNSIVNKAAKQTQKWHFNYEIQLLSSLQQKNQYLKPHEIQLLNQKRCLKSQEQLKVWENCINNCERIQIKQSYFDKTISNRGISEAPLHQNRPLQLITIPVLSFQQNKSKAVTNITKQQSFQEIKLKSKISYVTSILMNIYRDSQKVFKHGNTALLSYSPQNIKLFKYHQNNKMVFELQKINESWLFGINDKKKEVKQIQDIIRMVKIVNPHIHNINSLISFLGLRIKIPPKNHSAFTELLRSPVIRDLTRKQRKKLVQQVYLSIRSTAQQQISFKIQKNTKKSSIFYLRKRISENESNLHSPHQPAPPLTIKISIQEIKKELSFTTMIFNQEIPDQQSFETAAEDILYVAPSKIDRLGIFTSKSIDKHTIVAQYVGELISQAIADLRERSYHFGCYMFSLDSNNQARGCVIDATFKGNKARYLNHSCDPNCRAKIGERNNEPVIFIYTMRRVEQYEQLTYNYQFKKDSNQLIECKCKSPNCQKRLN